MPHPPASGSYHPRELTVAVLGRSAAAAGGAVAGVSLAFPLGAFLFVLLFERLGVPLVRELVSEGTEGLSGLDAFLAGALLAVVGVIVAICLVLALVAPVFVVFPLTATAAALRLTGAGGIIRSLWLMLGMVFALATVILPALSAFDLDAHWWVWLFIVASGAFAGRLTVELWKPDLAGRPADMTAVWRRWKGLGTAWLILAVVAVAGSFMLVLARVSMT